VLAVPAMVLVAVLRWVHRADLLVLRARWVLQVFQVLQVVQVLQVFQIHQGGLWAQAVQPRTPVAFEAVQLQGATQQRRPAPEADRRRPQRLGQAEGPE
jgi:hypothetical protein